jgi:hypothetical protein
VKKNSQAFADKISLFSLRDSNFYYQGQCPLEELATLLYDDLAEGPEVLTHCGDLQ